MKFVFEKAHQGIVLDFKNLYTILMLAYITLTPS